MCAIAADSNYSEINGMVINLVSNRHCKCSWTLFFVQKNAHKPVQHTHICAVRMRWPVFYLCITVILKLYYGIKHLSGIKSRLNMWIQARKTHLCVRVRLRFGFKLSSLAPFFHHLALSARVLQRTDEFHRIINICNDQKVNQTRTHKKEREAKKSKQIKRRRICHSGRGSTRNT